MYATNSNITNISGCMCPAYLTPLQTIKYIGSQKEQMLFNSGISCVEELVLICAKTCSFDEAKLSTYLQQICNIERTSALKVSRQILLNVLIKRGT